MEIIVANKKRSASAIRAQLLVYMGRARSSTVSGSRSISEVMMATLIREARNYCSVSERDSHKAYKIP